MIFKGPKKGLRGEREKKRAERQDSRVKLEMIEVEGLKIGKKYYISTALLSYLCMYERALFVGWVTTIPMTGVSGGTKASVSTRVRER